MRVGVIVAATLLIVIGVFLFFYGASVTNPRSVLSGSYLVVIGIFLAMAGFLMLASHVFRGRSIIY